MSKDYRTTLTLNRIRAVLERLAAPPQAQVDYLVALGVAPSTDEFALELDDLLPSVQQLVREGYLSLEQATSVYAVDQRLAEMGERPDVWEIPALEGHPDWQDIRQLAATSMEALTNVTTGRGDEQRPSVTPSPSP